jgi:uncharacterized integral membrane protein
MFKILRHSKKDYSEQHVDVKHELWSILKIILLLFVIMIVIMLSFSVFLPDSLFGMSKATIIIFIGSSISGVAALCAIIISYFQTREIQEENRKNIRSERIDSLKPFITLESINLPSEGLPPAQIKLSVTRSLNERGEHVLLFEKYKIDSRWSNPQHFRFNLKNIGNNSAHNCSLTMNGQKIFFRKSHG